jgi:2-iminobutanoate/2-iminopropanoate deaminase
MKITRHKLAGATPSGPYSPAVEVETRDLRQLYVSGQGTKDPLTGERVLGEISLQAKAAMDNLRLVVEESGFSMRNIVKLTIYLVRMSDFEAVNKVYSTYFAADEYPARVTLAAAGLPGGQGIEIDAIVVKET